jgi:hypothetical protein
MSKICSLEEIRSEVNRLAAQINAPDDLLPTYGYSRDFAYPHIEVDARGYHYVVVERGQEIERITTVELDELLYHVFEHITFELACKYELSRRVEHQDFRRLLFQHQIELLSALSPKWAEVEAQDHERILQQYPYDDNA